MSKPYERLDPHPIFKSIGKEVPGKPLAMIEGFVSPSKKGILSLVPSLDMRTRFDISEDDILYVESSGEEEKHKIKVYISDTADIFVYQDQAEKLSAKASEISAAQESFFVAEMQTLALALGFGSGSGTSSLDCLLRCTREKRRCGGLFPTAEQSRKCARKYNACRKKCIDDADKLIAL